ncbi:Clathrin light chain [Trypanosoma melophagium]|uniref:Clathrin light chain n=1 Tax=Trypanosoma melophagium TaxID=715481 RepID=UPI003519F224|nr:Clathrin light chain [Trypanosoma melophagium]
MNFLGENQQQEQSQDGHNTPLESSEQKSSVMQNQNSDPFFNEYTPAPVSETQGEKKHSSRVPTSASRDGSADDFFGSTETKNVPEDPIVALTSTGTASTTTTTAALAAKPENINGGKVLEAAKKEIQARTANIDAKTKEKEEKIISAAELYLKEENAKHAEKLKQVKAEHIRQQKSEETKRNEFKKSGAVWSGVALLTDLSKANKFSKGTERMRNILIRLGEMKNV